MSSNSCPYGASDCPKIHELQDEVDDVKRSIASMAKTLYLIAGILMVNLGVTLV